MGIEPLDHVYWVVGSPCAGKTTISDIIGQEHFWHVYHLDRYVDQFLDHADPHQHPHLTHYKAIGLRDFLALPAQTQLQRIIGMSMEYLQFVLADFAEETDDTPILVEGANFRIQDIMPYVLDEHHIVCMVPSEEFLFKTYPRRGTWVQDVLRYYPENQRLDVFEAWMTRDALHAQWASEQAHSHDVALITVDGTHTLMENAAMVEAWFGLPPYLT